METSGESRSSEREEGGKEMCQPRRTLPRTHTMNYTRFIREKVTYFNQSINHISDF